MPLKTASTFFAYSALASLMVADGTGAATFCLICGLASRMETLYEFCVGTLKFTLTTLTVLLLQALVVKTVFGLDYGQ